MRISFATLIGATLLAMALAPAGSSAASWGPPQKVSRGESAGTPVVAERPDGGVTMAWTRSGGTVRIADRDPGQPFQASGEITGESVSESVGVQAIDVAPNGTTALLLGSYDGQGRWLKVAVRPPGGEFGALETVAQLEQSNSDESIEIDDDGNVVVAWEKTTSVIVNGFPQTTDIEIFASVKPAGGGFGAPELLSTPEKWVFGLDMDGDADGNVTAVWPESTQSGVLINTRTIEPGGSFAPAETIDFGSSWFSPQIRYRADGSSSIFILDHGFRFADRPSGGSWGAPQTVTTEEGHGLDVRVGPDGSDTATWAATDGESSRVVATRRPAGGSFSTPTVISGSDDDAHLPMVATGPGPGAAIVWFERNGLEVLLRGAISDGTSFGADRNLAQLDSQLGLFDYGITGGGQTKTVWKMGTQDGKNSSIGVTDFGPGEVQPFTEISGLGGASSSLSVSFADSTAELTWQQGDGPGSLAVASIRGPWDSDIYSGDWVEGRATDPDSDSQGRANGRTARVWKAHHGDEVRIRGVVGSKDSYWPVAFTLTDPGEFPSDPVVSVGSVGATAAWQIDPSGPEEPLIQVVDFDSDGASAPVAVSGPGEKTGQPVVSGGEATPSAAVAWAGGPEGGDIRVAFRGAAGSAWETRTVSSPGTVNSDPQVAVRDDGGIVVTWAEASPAKIIRTAVKPPEGDFGEAIGSVQSGGTGSHPSLAVDGARFSIAWLHQPAGAGEPSILGATGIDSPGPTFKVSGSVPPTSGPKVATENGVRSIVWRGAGGRIFGTAALAGVRFPSPTAIAGGASSTEVPEVAVGSTGQTQAAWIGADGAVYGSVLAKPSPSRCPALRKLSLKRTIRGGRALEPKAVFRTGGKGLMTVRSKSLRRHVSAPAKAKRNVTLKLVLKKRAKRKLARRGSLRIKATVRFVPTGCRAVTKAYRLKLRR